ncbi:MAG: phasin family protein [Proteobacteria bacterium]|nr:phasin family protein [Pseudomonadota bacterium]
MTAARKYSAGKAGTAKPAKPAKPVEAAVATGAEAVETVVKAGAQVAAKGYEKAVAMGREQVETAVKAGAGAFKGYGDLAGFGKDNVQAVMTSGAILAKGVQDLNDVWLGLARASVEDAVGAAKALFGCKTLPEVVELQTGLAQAQYEKFVAESRRLSDMSAKLAENASAPITARVTVAVEKFTKPLAA